MHNKISIVELSCAVFVDNNTNIRWWSKLIDNRPVRKSHRAQTIEKMHHLKNGFASKSPWSIFIRRRRF
ncbi:MAG: hypothetical protein LBR79_04460 [Oscillospiraceae bacterium]|nr:hypothetical protein [Oscillospiraceae bacterium]